MTRSAALLVLGWACSGAALAAPEPPCPYTPEELSQQVGVKLKVVTQMRGLLGPACEYADNGRTMKISVDAGPNPAPSADAWRKMANPPGTQWKAVPNDPDKAVTLAAAPNGLHPSISYERKGWLVQINVSDSGGKSSAEAWNTKLLKLRRLPQ